MASILRTDSIQNVNTTNLITQTNATTITLGASGNTITTNATFQSNTHQNTSGTTIISQTNATTITLGATGQTVNFATGGTLSLPSSSVGLSQLTATGTAGSTTFLRGDNTWATPVATNYVKAYINYNASTQTLNGSYNVSSVTYNGTGNFTVNYTNALSTSYYAVAGISGSPSAADTVNDFVAGGTFTTSVTFATRTLGGSSYNPTIVCLGVFSNQ